MGFNRAYSMPSAVPAITASSPPESAQIRQRFLFLRFFFAVCLAGISEPWDD